MNSRLLCTFIAALALACLGGVTMAQGNPDAAAAENPVASAPESIAAGQASYNQYCASCHGRTAEGGVGSDLIPTRLISPTRPGTTAPRMATSSTPSRTASHRTST